MSSTATFLEHMAAYAREVCLNVGHVRTGVGDIDRCSRCGEPVGNQDVKESIEVSYKAKLDRAEELLGYWLNDHEFVHKGTDEKCRWSLPIETKKFLGE